MATLKDAALKEATAINVPASPLTSASADYYISSMIRLAASYLQNHDVAYLGHAIKLLRPSAGAACRKFGLKMFDEMIQTDPQVDQGISVLYMAGTNNELSFGAPKTYTDPDDIDSAQGAVRFAEEMFEQMDRPFDESRRMAYYDLLRYGNSFTELEFGYGFGRLKDHMIIKDAHAVDVDDVLMITDSFNRIIGFAPYGFPGVVGPLESWVPADSFVTYLFDAFDTQATREEYVADTTMLPRWKVIHQRWLPKSNDPRGSALLDSAFQPWWAKQQMMSILLLFFEQWGVPRKHGTLAEKADAVCIYGPDGKQLNGADGLPLQKDALPALLEALDKSGPGSSIALPYDYKLGLLQANADMAGAILKALDFFNVEISKAILKQHLASSEGQRGSEKGADNHSSILSLLILHGKGIQAEAIREQAVKPMIAANFGREARRYTPKADLGDADGLPVTLDEIGFLTQSHYFSPDQFPALDRKIGVQVRQNNGLEVPLNATQDAEKLYQIMAAKLFGAQAGQTLNIRFTK